MRRQLGVATQLFIYNLDPISVHCLASSAAESASLLAQDADYETFNDHIHATFPQQSLKDIRKLRNQYWTPIKHAREPSGQPFDLTNALAGFEDRTNDHTLFVVWHDYSVAGFPLPLEVQCFQVWYYGMYPEKLINEDAFLFSLDTFGDLSVLSRAEQKQRLRQVIGQFKRDPIIFNHPKTDQRPLILT